MGGETLTDCSADL